jgi:hypothetical protein
MALATTITPISTITTLSTITTVITNQPHPKIVTEMSLYLIF